MQPKYEQLGTYNNNSRKRVKVVIKTAKAAKFIDIALQTF